MSMFQSQEFPIPQLASLYDVPESSIDSWGQPSQSPTLLVSNVWLKVRPLKGNEILNVRQQWATASHYAELNWLADAIPVSGDNPGNGVYGYLMPEMKFILVKDGRVFNILQALNVDEMDQSWSCVLEEHYGATS